MLIVINALAPTKHPQARAIQSRIRQLSTNLALQHPDYAFLMIDDVSHASLQLPNVTTHVHAKSPNSWWKYQYWLDIQLPLLLRKRAVHTIIQPYGFTSTTVRCAQLLLTDGVLPLQQPNLFAKSTVRFYQLFAKASLHRASQIGVFSPQTYATIDTALSAVCNKAVQLPPVSQLAITPIEWEQKDFIKTTYTDGCEYFLYSGSLDAIGNIIILLKAFAVFKKWQKSNMKLVILSQSSTEEANLAEKIATYKYKEAVVIIKEPSKSDREQLLSAAYAAVLTAFHYPFSDTVLDILNGAVPVLIAKNQGWELLLHDAAIYTNILDAQEIGQHLIALYKNENLRLQYATKSVEWARQHGISAIQQQALVWQMLFANHD